MTYKKTLEKEIRKSEDSMMDNATAMLECSQYELGYQDGIKFALKEYVKQSIHKSETKN